MTKKIAIGLIVAVILIFLLAIAARIFINLTFSNQGTIAPAVFGPETAVRAPLTSLSPFAEKQDGRNVADNGILEQESRLVIKTGNLNMVVKDINGSAQGIAKYAEASGGWVVSSAVYEREKVLSGSITIRVPFEKFEETMDYIRDLAEKVTYETTQGQDITEEYTDLRSRLKNLEAAETQFLKIMERSGTISDILAVQRELNTVRNQIEQAKGRIQYLEESVKMSTITVNMAISEDLLPIPLAEKWRPKYIVARAWTSALNSLRGISYLLIWIVVYAVIWVPLAIIIWQARKAWKKKKGL